MKWKKKKKTTKGNGLPENHDNQNQKSIERKDRMTLLGGMGRGSHVVIVDEGVEGIGGGFYSQATNDVVHRVGICTQNITGKNI